MNPKKLNKILITIIPVIGLYACNSGTGTTTTPDNQPVQTLNFKPVGETITRKIATAYPDQDSVVVSFSDVVESHLTSGKVAFLQIKNDATASTKFTEATINYNKNEVQPFGSLTVASNGLRYLPSLLLTQRSFTLGSYNQDGSLHKTSLLKDDNTWFRPVKFMASDNNNLYWNQDTGSGKGSLCHHSLSQNDKSVCQDGVFPKWYNGEFVVKNNNLYYSTTSGVEATSLDGQKSRQVGAAFTSLPAGYQIAPGMLDTYKDRIYTAATYSQDNTLHLATCSISMQAQSDGKWSCSYSPQTTLKGRCSSHLPICIKSDPSTQATSHSEIVRSFKIDAVTGKVVVIVTDSPSYNSQLYTASLK